MSKRENPLNPRQMEDLKEALSIAADATSRFSLPIYKLTESGLPDLVGTGFVIDFHGSCYFVTAAHVMDHHEVDRPLFYFVNSKQRQYIEGPCRTSSTNVADRKNDQIDLTVVKLPDGEGRPSEEIQKSVIFPGMITQDTSKIGDCRFIVPGYPLTKYDPDKKQKLLNPACFTWMGKSIPDETYKRLKFKKSQNLLIQFGRKHVMRTDEIVGSMFPEPRGVSGSPVWHTVGYRNEERILVIEEIFLAGVLIEHIPEGKCFLATSIDIVMSMIIDLDGA
ncbi:hypothetical protein [Pseudomonas sp. JL3]|uniref:hypothetical protein n=1 Tax=Pseudomonas sp. JL3 TaxID=2919943 RepID=UPI0028666404|nr:hypothetical protein [Pseudomonas sp. JL3]MDR8365039.1 serine protease [Pseudomonas sp. JL3]